MILSRLGLVELRMIARIEAQVRLRAVIEVTGASSTKRGLYERLAYRWRFASALPTVMAERSRIRDRSLRDDGPPLLRALDTDLLVVCAAPILSPAMVRVPTIAAVNLHYGVVPDYRGMHGIFWALVNRDYERVGVTLHHLAKKVDRGAVLAKGYPALRSRDTEASILARCADLGAELVVHYVDAVAAGARPSGIPQMDTGRTYRDAERDLRAQARFALAERFGARIPSTDRRVERFY
ncbi:MAG: formyltransferase family protein [Myxococcota bacterium]